MVFSSPLSFVSRTKGIDVDQSVPDLAIKFGGLIVPEFPRAIFHNKLDIRDDAIGMDGLVLVQAKLIMTHFWLQRGYLNPIQSNTKERPNLAVFYQ